MTAAPTRVLLVDDDEDDYLITRDLLARTSDGTYTLDWVTSFEAGLATANAGLHDVYLLDYRLGADSGLDLLRAMIREGCRAPVILLTGQGDRGVDGAAMEAGAADYLVKGEMTTVSLERALRHARDREHILVLREALAVAEAAQDRLLASQQFALATLDALPEHIAILDAAGVILAVNAAWRRFAGDNCLIHPTHIIGRNYVTACAHAAAAGDDLARRAAEGISDVLSGRATTFALEYPCHGRTYQHWFALDVAPYADTGPGRIMVAHHDVTARTLAREELLRREHGFRLLFSTNPQPMWVYDVVTLRFLEVNDAAVEHYGYSHAEFLAMRVTDIQSPGDPDPMIGIEDAGLPAIMEQRCRCKDGRDIDVAINAHALEFAGQSARLVVAIDITARKLAEAALRASNHELARSNTELEQFASVASHDLRSPLNTIGSYAQLLSLNYTGKLDADADEFLSFIMDAVKRMHGFIDDLLTLAHIGAPQAPPALVDCTAIVGRVIAQLRSTIMESGVVVTHHGLPTVLGQASQLAQLFQNLIANAIKFHGEVSPHVAVTASRGEGEWLFSVQDNGIGIEPAYAERIFVAFQRLHTRDEYPGTGMGLTVCKKIVERRGGRIWVEAQPGQGSRFLFTLPDAVAS